MLTWHRLSSPQQEEWLNWKVLPCTTNCRPRNNIKVYVLCEGHVIICRILSQMIKRRGCIDSSLIPILTAFSCKYHFHSGIHSHLLTVSEFDNELDYSLSDQGRADARVCPHSFCCQCPLIVEQTYVHKRDWHLLLLFVLTRSFDSRW